MGVKMSRLRDDSNVGIIDNIRKFQSDDYQRRIPEASKAGLSETLKQLGNHRPRMNEFLDALVNRIGSVYTQNIVWSNPLAEFKRGMLSYGDTIEEIQVGLLQAHTYDPDRDYMEKAIFGTETAHVESNFHRVNRQDYYKITVDDGMLRRAFLEEGGLNDFINQMLSAPTTSDNWDEFLLTCKLFSEYAHNGGFYQVHIEPPSWGLDNTHGERAAKEALRKIRAMGQTLSFPSTRYNAAKMPTFSRPEDMVLFATPEFQASLDVEALAAAFNIERADVPNRIITIPYERFGIDGAQAILTNRDFFVIADTRLENTSQYNPVSLRNNYFLHHHEIISASRFVPAVLFGDVKDSEVIEITNKVLSVKAPEAWLDGNKVTTVAPGAIYELTAEVVSEHDDGAVQENESVIFSVKGAESPWTYISSSGVLHVGDNETSKTLTITAVSTDRDSGNIRKEVKPSPALTLTVEGDTIPLWPVPVDEDEAAK